MTDKGNIPLRDHGPVACPVSYKSSLLLGKGGEMAAALRPTKDTY